MRRPHVYERSAPRRNIRRNTPFGPGPYADGYRTQCDGAPREAPSYAGFGSAQEVTELRAGWLLGYDGGAADAEQDRKAQDRAWAGRLGITRQ